MSGLMINLFLMKQSSLRISADTILSYQKLQNKEVNLQKLCISEVMDQKIFQIYISTLQKECFQKRNLINSEAVIGIRRRKVYSEIYSCHLLSDDEHVSVRLVQSVQLKRRQP